MNNSKSYDFTYGTEQKQYFIIEGKSLIEALHLNDSNALAKYPKDLVKVTDDSITFTMKYHGSHYYATNENIFFFAPINNSAQISYYKTNYFRIPKQYAADDTIQQFRVIKPFYILSLPEYIYFDCP